MVAETIFVPEGHARCADVESVEIAFTNGVCPPESTKNECDWQHVVFIIGPAGLTPSSFGNGKAKAAPHEKPWFLPPTSLLDDLEISKFREGLIEVVAGVYHAIAFSGLGGVVPVSQGL